jgi:flagellar basal-body rod modification protein FlgD
MPTSAITAIGARTAATSTVTPNSAGAASATAGQTELGRDAFLQLLVAQLRYQDPSKPADAASLISQSTQLAVVDKLDTISTSIDRSATATRVDLASNLIGREVSYTGADGYQKTATVTSVRFDGTDTYVLAGGAEVPLELVLGVTGPASGASATAAAAAAATSTASTAAAASAASTSSSTSSSTSASTSTTAGAAGDTTSNIVV